MPEEKRPDRKQINVTKTLKKIMADHFYELDEHGKRISFKMNGKCAVGTGTFLEEMSARLKRPFLQWKRENKYN